MPYSLTVIDKLLIFLGSSFLRLLYSTLSISIKCDQETENILKSKESLILASWHCNILLLPYLRHTSFSNCHIIRALISGHRDGRRISGVIKSFNIETIVGSSTRGAVSASKEIIKCLRKKEVIFITPDGPKGPARVAKEGFLKIIEITKVNLITIEVKANSAYRFNSWDKAILPFPFTKVEISLKANALDHFPTQVQHPVNKLESDSLLAT